MTTQPATKRHARLFFSYGRDDAEFVRGLTTRLQKSGVDTFDSAEVSTPGQDWSSAILKALEKSDKVIFVVPSHEGGGKNALAELGAARAMGKPILAVMPDSSRAWNSDVARAISNTAVLDASRVDERNLVSALAS
jgi:hypothetical protein